MFLLSCKGKRIVVASLDAVVLIICLLAKKLSVLMIEHLKGCPVFEKLGIKCLTCGGTRCVNALFDGRIKEALAYNSFVVILGIFLLALLFVFNLGWGFGVEKAEDVLKKICTLKLVLGWCFVGVLFMLLRNILPFLTYYYSL